LPVVNPVRTENAIYYLFNSYIDHCVYFRAGKLNHKIRRWYDLARKRKSYVRVTTEDEKEEGKGRGDGQGKGDEGAPEVHTNLASDFKCIYLGNRKS